MAEWALKIGDSPTLGHYQDGDIIDVFNRRRIRLAHADMICHPRIAGKKVGGLLNGTQPLLEKYYQRQSQYKWERVSRTEIKRTNLWTLAEVVYGSTPIEDPDRKGHMIHCHVDELFKFRLKSAKLPIFGEKDREIEYGGNLKRDAATVELLWDDIEHDTPLRRADHDIWPAGVADLRVHLFVSVDEFDDAEAEDLKSPLTRVVPITEENPEGIEIVKKRKYHADWRAEVAASLSNSASVATIEDSSIPVDIRTEETFVRANIRQTKTVEVVVK